MVGPGEHVFLSLCLTEFFFNGHGVAQTLAGVIDIGFHIDDWNRGVLREAAQHNILFGRLPIANFGALG